jgi:hypothetical protein
LSVWFRLRRCRVGARRALRAGMLAFGWLCALARPCHADDVKEPAPLLKYRTPQQTHYLRLTLEEILLLGAGLGQYWYDREQNSRDWQFNYDWASFRARLNGQAYAFDTNGFDTNFLFHPAAGTLYYLTARSNRFSPFESLAIAFGTSAIWEFFGEFQEKVSVNDVVVTPVAGMALGETLTQLGAYFLRQCPSTSNQILGTVLAPFTVLHDAVDGAERLTVCDREPPSAQRFRIQLQAGETWSEGHSPYGALRAGVEAEVIHLPGFARLGSDSSMFTDGNVSRLRFTASFSNVDELSVSDLQFLTQTVIAGLHSRNNTLEGGAVHRRETLFGFMVGAEYTRHRYNPRAEPDRIFLLDLPALTTRYYGRTRDLGWELSLDAGGAFGGADSLVLSQKVTGAYNPELTSVASAEGYNHVVGVTLNPRARVDLGLAELGLEFRGERLIGWRALDRTGHLASTSIGESRRRTVAWVSLGAPRLERLLFSVGWTERTSSLGEVSVKRNELSVNFGLELAP